MGQHRTLKNHLLRLNGSGRYGRKALKKRSPYAHVGIAGFEWGHLHMTHYTKGPRVRHMSDKLYNLIVLSAESPEAAQEKVRQYWTIVFEGARTSAQERHYPLV